MLWVSMQHLACPFSRKRGGGGKGVPYRPALSADMGEGGFCRTGPPDNALLDHKYVGERGERE